MSLLKSSDFKNLKTRMRAELSRRKYNNRVDIYRDSASYAVQPTDGGVIYKEHYDKIVVDIERIRSVSSSPATITHRTTGSPSADAEKHRVLEFHPEELDARITLYESRDILVRSAASNDCAQGCAGGCYTGCATSCTGCTGSCTGGCGGCGNTCYGECRDDCTAGCTGTCNRRCADDCTGTCAETCSGTGIDSCADDCTGGCTGSCRVTCYGGCDGT